MRYLGIIADSPAKRIALVEEQCRFGVDESGAGDGGSDLSGGAVEPTKAAGEGAAEDTLLNPRLVFFELLVSGEAGEFGAGASTARGAIVGFAGALNEIAGIGTGNRGRTEEFDMVDFGKALIVNGLTNAPTEFGELVGVGER